MSHVDKLSKPPPNFRVIGHTGSAPYAAIAHNSKPFTVFSSIQKLRTPQTGKQSLEILFLIYADVDRIGRW